MKKQAKKIEGKTHAISRLQFVLVDPAQKPLFVAGTFDTCLGQFVHTRKGIILDDTSREAHFEVLKRKGYSIRRCYAWIRVAHLVEQLPPTKK